MSTVDRRVLSIQSTVVSGYVGNKSATFPLQIHEFDACAINSVQLSNHTWYKCFKGQVLDDNDVACLYDGLKENDIHHFSHMLTGYIGSKSFLEKVGEIIEDQKKVNPEIVYVCDPVMGDNGKLYVPKELLPVYQDVIVPQADIVTPNQFEAELLTGRKIKTEADALEAMQILHDKGPQTVVLSSSDLGGDDMMLALASTVKDGCRKCYKMEIPLLPAFFVGTGDLFAASLLIWMNKDNNLQTALEKTVSTVQAVIKRTLKHAQGLAGDGKKPTIGQLELRLVQSKTDIENPTITFKAVSIL